jgi:hypothetical protein
LVKAIGGGLGIVLDDVAAAFYTSLVMNILLWRWTNHTGPTIVTKKTN